MAPTAAMRRRREAIVREHMDSENRHEFDTTLETFDHPRYELIATGEVHDGPKAVQAYFDETRRAFPDQRNEAIALHHTDEGVLVEAYIRGTHKGPFRGLPRDPGRPPVDDRPRHGPACHGSLAAPRPLCSGSEGRSP